jgi:hypothetical protein
MPKTGLSESVNQSTLAGRLVTPHNADKALMQLRVVQVTTDQYSDWQ